MTALLHHTQAQGGRTFSSGSAIMVSLLRLLGVSAKHLSDEVSTTVSQKADHRVRHLHLHLRVQLPQVLMQRAPFTCHFSEASRLHWAVESIALH